MENEEKAPDLTFDLEIDSRQKKELISTHKLCLFIQGNTIKSLCIYYKLACTGWQSHE